jgi:hypothetical protein
MKWMICEQSLRELRPRNRDIRLPRNDLAFANSRRERAGADLLTADPELSEIAGFIPPAKDHAGQPAEMWDVGEGTRLAEGSAGAKEAGLAALRNESAHSGRELAKETETNRAVGAHVDRLQIGLQTEEGRRMKRQ